MLVVRYLRRGVAKPSDATRKREGWQRQPNGGEPLAQGVRDGLAAAFLFLRRA
jgi:hypothetical protein